MLQFTINLQDYNTLFSPCWEGGGLCRLHHDQMLGGGVVGVLHCGSVNVPSAFGTGGTNATSIVVPLGPAAIIKSPMARYVDAHRGRSMIPAPPVTLPFALRVPPFQWKGKIPTNLVLVINKYNNVNKLQYNNTCHVTILMIAIQ